MIRVVIDQKDLGRLGRAFQRVKGAFVDLDGLVHDIAEEYATAVMHNIISQNLPNHPVRTKAYMEKKRREGAPEHHWVYKYRAYEAIGIRKGSRSNSYEVWSWDIPHAKWMEYGGGAPTPVPVFEWTLELYEPMAITKVKKWFAKVAAVYV